MKTSALILSLFMAWGALAQPAATYQPSLENLKQRAWFDSARFGMFIHWGPSSLLGAGEWVMNNRGIHYEDYGRLAKFFNPVDFNAADWVATAKNAGAQYITLITRHHDGFSLWDTKQSDFNIMNTPFKRDVVREIANECHKQGIKLFFYYSTLDWRHPDYHWQTGKTGQKSGRTNLGDWSQYIAFMKAQLTELLLNYGPVAGIWLDGHWDQLDNDHDKTLQSKVNWHYDELYSLIHYLQPACLIGNNHHLEPVSGEDFQMFERDLPGQNSAGLSGQSISKLPLESCQTINGAWGFNIADRSYKSNEELIHFLVNAAGLGSNLLLNVGPMPNGEIQPEFKARLAGIGEWLKVNGETIYGTQGGFVKPQEWGCITQKEDKLYIHLLKPTTKPLELAIPGKVKSMVLFADKSVKVAYTQKNGVYTIPVSPIPPTPIDTIVEVTLK